MDRFKILPKMGTLVPLLLALASISSALYFSDNPFAPDDVDDIPIFFSNTNKIQNPFTAAYPVVKTPYDVELMRPIEAMPGKKTVTLYVVPQNSLKLHSHSPGRRFKRASLRFGIAAPAKYPQYLGLTDGYHIPAVEIPLRKALVIRNTEVRVSAPSGFMVPYYREDGFHPYPMSTGCLIAPIPPGVAVSNDNPYEIRRLFAVPGLPEYPTSRPVIEQHNHLHIHGQEDEDLSDTLSQFFEPKPTFAVFELVPVTEKSKKKKKKPKPKDSSEEDDETTTTTTTTAKPTTTTTTTAATTTTTTTTTTEATTTAAASSIQDIIASFSNRRFEQERVSSSRGPSASPLRSERERSGGSSDLASRETSYLQQLRQQSLRRQLDQLQKLLSSLNLGTSDRSSLEAK